MDGIRLDGRVALVTGAARGIGRAIATALAERGADVAVADVRPEIDGVAEDLAKLGRRAAAERIDVTSRDEIVAGVARIRERLGPIDVLVNNAGIVDHIAAVERMTPEGWERELRVNLTGAFHLIQATIGPMIERRYGRIVNISSIAAKGGIYRQAAYAASKAGLLGLTETVALEHGRHGVTCNAILPGLIATENVLAMPEEIRESAIGVIPARRLGETREIGAVVAFLASEGAGYVNGAAIPVDGGFRLNTAALGSRRELRDTRR